MPVRLAIVSDFELVVAGVEAILAPHRDGVVVVELPIARNLSNQEIAKAAYLSISSVKSHIRTAYCKLGVTRRSQAVGWVLQSGFASGSRRHSGTSLAEPAHGHDGLRVS